MQISRTKLKNGLLCTLSVLFCLASMILCFLVMLSVHYETAPVVSVSEWNIKAHYDEYIADCLLDAENAARSVKKRFWLPDDADKGPVPNPDCYGTSDNPAELDWLFEEAADILDGQTTLFTTQTPIKPNSQITYYLDESIFAVTWKQILRNYVYTISEIKISHPSQFRRHLAGGSYDSTEMYPTTVMSREVNAVVGSSADHFRRRKFGIIVYDGEVKRIDQPHTADVCYVDKNGDLHFSYHGDLMDLESAQKFVDERNISFSIAFGPILVDNGKRCEPYYYPIGQIEDEYARAALCQMDELHYLVITANSEGYYCSSPTIHDFAAVISNFGCQKAYTLDGGNTGTIAMNGILMNDPPYEHERNLSDIIYFCTALPHHSS